MTTLEGRSLLPSLSVPGPRHTLCMWQMDGAAIVSVLVCKLKNLATDMQYGTILPCRYDDITHSIFVTELAMIGIRYRYSANKRILIISAYFLAAACDKRMRLLTSLYGTYIIILIVSILLGRISVMASVK